MSIAKRSVAAGRKVGHAVRARVTRQRLTATTTHAQPIEPAMAEPVQETASASSSPTETAVAECTATAGSHKETTGTDEVLSMLEALTRDVAEIKAWMGVAATTIAQSRETALETREAAAEEHESDIRAHWRDIDLAVSAFPAREADIEEREAALKDRGIKVEKREIEVETQEEAILACKTEVEEREAILEGRETEVKGIDRAIDRAESQQKALDIGVALAEARHNASLFVIARAESCEEIAIADTSICTETPVDIPAAGADAIREIYDAIARAKSSREALDSGVVIVEEADAAVQRAIASVDEREMATDGEYEYEYEYKVAANDDEREMASNDDEPATARAGCHMGITMALEHVRNISQDLHTHMEDGSSDADDEVAATANVAKALDSAIALVDVNLGPVAILEVAKSVWLFCAFGEFWKDNFPLSSFSPGSK
ncbi:hypothetical protein GGI17_006553 [Coemansia sp. S146]|nr:hypothetical protein GGI17_006553 [Coemansia sp. S146]